MAEARLEVEPIAAVPMICKANPVTEFDVMWLTAAAAELAKVSWVVVIIGAGLAVGRFLPIDSDRTRH
jgi:hypothetical protein